MGREGRGDPSLSDIEWGSTSSEAPMDIDMPGRIRMRGESEDVEVMIHADRSTLRLSSGETIIGEWKRDEIGIHALAVGFVVRVEGEEMVLTSEDDAALAEALDLASASPRIAKQVAARHRPLDGNGSREAEPDEPPGLSRAVVLAVGGGLVVLGAAFLSLVVRVALPDLALAYYVAGVLLVACSVVMPRRPVIARWVSYGTILVVVIAVAVTWRLVFSEGENILAHSIIAAGLAVALTGLSAGKDEPGG